MLPCQFLLAPYSFSAGAAGLVATTPWRSRALASLVNAKHREHRKPRRRGKRR